MKNLIISEATANGVDIGMRVNLMYKFILGGTIAVVVFYKLIQFLETKFHFSFLRQYELMLLSASIICMAFLQVMDGKSLTTLKLLEIIFWVRLFTLLPVKKFDFGIGILKSKIVFSLCLIFAFYSLFATFLLFGSEEFVRKNIAWIYSAFLFIFSTIYILFCKRNYQNYKQITAFLLPLASIPYIAFLSLEIMFYVKQSQDYFISYKWLFVALLGIIWFLMNFFYLRKKRKEVSINTMIRRWIAPSMVVAFVLLAFYTPVLQPVNEMFEFANAANSVMNVFEFGKIPLLDFMSSHVMAEQWYGYLYSLIFGYDASMDFLVYNFFNTLFFYFILYWFLNKLFHRPLLSLFFLFFFPFVEEVFYLSVFVAIIPFFLSRQLLERATAKSFFNLFLALTLLILWKLDTGVAAIFAAAFYFPLLYFVTKTKFPLIAFLKGLALFGCILAGLLLIAILLRSPSIVINDLKMSLHYFSASQAHGLKEIMTSYTQQFYIYHILFPFVGVVSCGYILITLRKKQKNHFLFAECHILLASLFLFLLFFANLQRGLVRHGFAEHGELVLVSTFFAAASLLVLYWFQSRSPVLNTMLFYVTGFSLLILLKFFPFHTSEATLNFALNNNAISTINEAVASPDYFGRTKVDIAFAHENYLLLRDFLDKNIKKEQTFLDFSNTPMLYYYCERSIPGYFNQNLQNTVDDYLQLELLKDVNTDKVPVVIFASYPRAWFDATDGIPNVVRYYLVAEYIFNHYKPYGVIGNKSVWVSNTFHTLPAMAKTDSIITQTDNAELNLIPEYTGSFYSDSKHSKDLKMVYSKTKDDLNLQNDSLSLSLDAFITSLRGCYLSVEFEKRKEWFEPFQTQILFRDTAGISIGVFSFTRRDLVSSRYMIRLSNHYFWHQHHSLELRISSGSEIKQISILKDTRVEN